MKACAIAGCVNEAIHSLGVRCRRPDTSALWAPSAKVGLCDDHARHGLRVTLELEPIAGLDGVLIECNGAARYVEFSESIAR